jgi:hypothetical protein
MAAKESTSTVRPGRNRPGRPHPPKLPREALLRELRTLTESLGLIEDAAIVAAAVLRAQRVDHDVSVATVLRHHVSDRLRGEIERSEALLATLGAQPAGLEDAD